MGQIKTEVGGKRVELPNFVESDTLIFLIMSQMYCKMAAKSLQNCQRLEKTVYVYK